MYENLLAFFKLDSCSLPGKWWVWNAPGESSNDVALQAVHSTAVMCAKPLQ